MDADACRAIVRRWYDEVWAAGNLDVIDELVDEDVRFRGALGNLLEGRSDLAGYVEGIRRALPDLRCTIDQVVAQDGAVAVRASFRGTQEDDLMGVPASGRTVTFTAASFFRLDDGRIVEGWVLGDLSALRRQLTDATPR